MIIQTARSWASSPVGLNLLLAYCRQSGPVVDKYSQINHQLRTKECVTLKNKLFYTPSHIVKNVANLCIDTEEVDFKKTTNTINEWIDKNAGEKDLVLEPQTFVDSSAVLANISIFKSPWKSSVDPVGPKMITFNSFNYTQDVKYEARILEYPMQDSDFKLIIIVPNHADVLHSLFKRLSDEGLETAISSIQPLFMVESELKTPNIVFKSEIKIDISKSLSHNTFDDIAVQYSDVNIDESEVFIKSLTYLQSTTKNNLHEDESSKAEAPFFFAVVFKDTPIFVGQYVK